MTTKYIKVKDFSVSKKEFNLLLDHNYHYLKTTPQPLEKDLPLYYQSEDYISHTDRKKTLFEKMYFWVKQYTLQQKINLIANYTSGKKLLDIGAGTGDFLLKAKKNNWKITGIEPNEKARKIAKEKNITLLPKLEKIPNNKFDVITMWHVLEHIPDLDNYLNKLYKLLQPNGIIIVAVPNYKSYDAKHYKEFWAAYDVPRHLWHFSKKSIQLLFQEKNFSLIKIKPMWFDSFYVSLLSEKYKTKKMNFIKGFFFGLLSNLSGLFTKEFSSHIYILRKETLKNDNK